ncbi:MAG: hypothetical protein IT427_09330 [Pirellulales bacterium]|nr:hypothetical protein [Pirellulales bacterium]
MGGFGSGNWYRWQERKSTVEESLSLAMRDFRGRIFQGAAGTLTWTWTNGGNKSSVGWFVTGGDVPTITFHYRWRDSEDVRIPVWLQTTPTQFGGERWWFTCPLIVNGVACNRRVGKLFLPPGARYFGCRKCHGLTYRSCQEAHQTERLFGRMERIDKLESRLAAIIDRQR